MDTEVDLLGERIAEQAAHLDAATHRLLADLRQFDALGGWHLQGARTCAHWLAWRVGWDLVTARERVRVARKLGECPATDDALRRGELSYSKVRAILRVATPANEALLLECARLSTASQLETLSRKYARVQAHDDDASPRDDEQRRYVRRCDTCDGMVRIEAVLHPEEAELVWAMLDHAAKQLTRGSHVPTANDPQEPSIGYGAAVLADIIIGCADDLAETSVAAEACGMAPSGVHRAREVADSGELVDVPERGSGTACPEVGAARSLADSAESVDVPERGSGMACPEVGAARSLADSAESTAAAVASSGMACPGAGVTRLFADSAESVAAAGASSGMVRPGVSVARQVADPAEPVDVPECSRGMGCSGAGVARSLSDSAESTATAGSGNKFAPPREDAARSFIDSADSVAAAKATGSAADDRACSARRDLARPVSPSRQAAETARRAFNRADALLGIAHAYLRGDRPDRAPVDVMVTIPLADLRHGTTDPTAVGCTGASFVAAETARRLGCDAGVIEVVEDANGVPLSVGRKRRAIAGSIKRALLKRDTACTYPGCENRIFLEGHHIQHWADGGETTLENACLLCSHHHRFVHEYGYQIELGPEGRPRFRDPRGRIVASVPGGPPPPALGWPTIRAANIALDIDAETIACGWDGTSMRYGTVVDQLVTADGLT
ncbi:MAG TPA: DUF222 domain-containing protein [Kofleriaceae bacterium]|nr:DUF222 domain-containing protein [Kofleriaceae bacterium]